MRCCLRCNEIIRNSARRRLGLSNNVVVGHVGRFEPQKNHERLLHIFSAVYGMKKSARLLLVGKGTLSDTIHKLAHEMQIEQAIIFAGEQDDVSAWYQAMDVFVMPSIFEGVPLASIEAQTAGLPCVLSCAIPRDAGFGKYVSFIHQCERIVLTDRENIMPPQEPME